MSKESTSSSSEIIFGEARYNTKENNIEMPPKNALKKYLEEQKENMIEIVVHANTREILEKLNRQKDDKTH